MFVAGVNEEYLPLQDLSHAPKNELAAENFKARERALLYVAATRARKQVFVWHSGKVSPLLNGFIS